MTRALGCPNGCPLDHHEPPCPKATRAEQSDFERGYAAGFAAGLRQAGQETAIYDRAQQRAREDRERAARPRPVVRIERLDREEP